jgi:hypothetical protein
MERKTGVRGILADIKTYRRAYILTVVASFGGMLFGWDTGLIGGVLTMPAFQHSLACTPSPRTSVISRETSSPSFRRMLLWRGELVLRWRQAGPKESSHHCRHNLPRGLNHSDMFGYQQQQPHSALHWPIHRWLWRRHHQRSRSYLYWGMQTRKFEVDASEPCNSSTCKHLSLFARAIS